jgi:hypothetical protein
MFPSMTEVAITMPAREETLTPKWLPLLSFNDLHVVAHCPGMKHNVVDGRGNVRDHHPNRAHAVWEGSLLVRTRY